jgi:hypothetical protein
VAALPLAWSCRSDVPSDSILLRPRFYTKLETEVVSSILAQRVIFPNLSARMKVANDFAGLRERAKVSSLCLVAIRAGQCEIGKVTGTTMFDGDYVINMMFQKCPLLMDVAVFTP